ncbi:Inosose dehydratase [subsurface metagenome]|nr:TIM barrel protein [Clostridia bacterium]
MKVAYMTNAWGGVVGHPAGVTSIKDLFYLSTGPTKDAVSAISKAGFSMIEIFDGNLMEYSQNKEEFKELLSSNNLTLLAVYFGANFIYREIIEEEFYKIEKAAEIASEFGAKHLVVGGGAIRSEGIKKEDYDMLGQGLNEIIDISKNYNLIASYHPHLGTIVQGPDQLDILMPLTDINLCPDTGHVEAGGGNSIEVVTKYVNRIKYIHLKDYDSGRFLPLGEGKIDFGKIINILLDTGFDGEFTVEADGYEGDPAKAAELSYNYLSNYLK